MNNQFLLRWKAFTLIELMLVITIFAVMSIYTVSMLKNRQYNLNIAQTANQINALFAQANRYYVNNSTAIAQESVSITQDLILAGYIQDADLCTVWPSSSGTGGATANTSCPGKATLDVQVKGQSSAPNQPYSASIMVTLSLSSNYAGVADAIMVRLPNATLVGNEIQAWYNLPLRNLPAIQQSTEVEIQSKIPGITFNYPSPGLNQFGYMTGGGWAYCANPDGYDTDSNGCDSIPLPNCPQGYEGHFLVFPYYYTTDRWQYYPDTKSTTFTANKVFYQFNYAMDNGGVVTGPTTDNPTITLLDMSTFNPNGTSSSGSMANRSNSLFITFCVPEGTWSSAASRSYGQGLGKNKELDGKINCSNNDYTCEGQCTSNSGGNGGSWYEGTYICGNPIRQ